MSRRLPNLWILWHPKYAETIQTKGVILRLHHVPGGHSGRVSDNSDKNGITVRQRRGTG